MTDEPTEQPQVRDHPEASRYEIYVAGQVAGFTRYVRHGDVADFVHTQIAEEFGGHGLASRLIHAALDDARRRGWQVVPYCPFVRAFMAKHPEYRDLVPATERVRFDLAD
jgi:predicted GNAT family acetyltransferase